MYLILTCFVLQFCSWENPHFSSTVLSELLWQVSKSGVILEIVFCEVYKSRYRMWLIMNFVSGGLFIHVRVTAVLRPVTTNVAVGGLVAESQNS